jgi:hypothetical protein
MGIIWRDLGLIFRERNYSWREKEGERSRETADFGCNSFDVCFLLSFFSYNEYS